jgi:hypothetical protein
METFPLMSCSVAACNNLYRPYKSLGEIARDAGEVKSFLKSQKGSHYLRDRRSEPIQKLDEAIAILPHEVTKTGKPVVVETLLGKLLLDAGLISQDELSQALKRHMQTGQRLGQTLIAMNLVRSEDIGRMLEKKLSVPYVSLRRYSGRREVMRLFSLEFMKAHRVVPVEMTQDGLKLAMCDPFDIRTLDAIERVSSLRPIPYLALEDEFEEFIEFYSGHDAQESKIG